MTTIHHRDKPDEPPFKNLDCMNGWYANPPEYVTCITSGHRLDVIRPPYFQSGLRSYACPICRIKWTSDSSD